MITDTLIEKMIIDMESKIGTVYAAYLPKLILIEASRELQWYRQQRWKKCPLKNSRSCDE